MSDRNSRTYSSSSSPSQSSGWAPPKNPLPPHKLAKLANALGIPTPIPAYPPSPNSSSSPTLSLSPLDILRRPPTPSTAFTHNLGHSHPMSKFLLHVIPPEQLLHDLEPSDTSQPLLPTASGYHVQFRRGILVPMHATLQSQLGAIAKEYALPSTTGLILYLVQPVSGRNPNSITGSADAIEEEPGPRLSEDIWRFLWARVIQTEREESPRSPAPNMLNLGFKFGIHPSYSLHELKGSGTAPPAVPSLKTPQPKAQALTPSSSAPSSASDIRSQSKSAPPSSSSISQSDPPTPDTSAALHSNPAEQFELPGLHSSSFVPILAKVEFDIDRRNAAWYEPWLRSRRMNQAKRSESRSSKRTENVEETETGGRRPPLDLMLVNRVQAASPSPSFSISITENSQGPTSEGYGLLSESPQEMNSDDSDSEKGDSDQETTTRVASAVTEDPLSDVFGTDADTWDSLHDSSQHRRVMDPHILDLTLDAADLSGTSGTSFEDDLSAEILAQKEEDEVRDLLDAMSHSHLAVTITPSPPLGNQQQSSRTNNLVTKKHVPPPLIIQPRSEGPVIDTQPSPLSKSSGNSPKLSYLAENYDGYRGDDTMFSISSDGMEDEYARFRRPLDEKRDGGVFDRLELGLEDFGNYDDDDPNDRRKSQYAMKAKLDEIEKTLAQFSPQRLKTDASVENLVKQSSASSETYQRTLHFNNGFLSPTSIPPNPEIKSHQDRDPAKFEQSKWPAVPFSSMLAEASRSRTTDAPLLAVNGVSTAIPTFQSQSPLSSSSPGLQTETEVRKRELTEQQLIFSPPKSPQVSSPVIPMSPDPFRRYPSTVSADSPKLSMPSLQPEQTSSAVQDAPSQRRPSKEKRTSGQNQSNATSSRFSADSITINDDPQGPKNRATLINVKGFKNLWRKNKSSISGHIISAPVPVPSTSPLLGAPTPSARSSSERLPPTPFQHSRASPTLDQLHFNQDSPYPMRRSPASTRPTTPNVPPPLPDKEGKERSIRKSILKSWKSPSVSLSSNSGPSPEPRSSTERSAPSKSRRPSVLSSASASTSLNSPELPASPAIPQHFFHARPNGTDSDRRQSSKSKLTDSMVDSLHPPSPTQHGLTGASPPRPHSAASSRASDDTRHSFDTSQFEMVSPHVNSSLVYPYHGSDFR